MESILTLLIVIPGLVFGVAIGVAMVVNFIEMCKDLKGGKPFKDDYRNERPPAGYN